MQNKNYYITTTLPYVNARPHIGFALEIIQADVLARWYRSRGVKVFFNTGTDEHGLKIFQKALELGKTPQEYCDESAEHFKSLKKHLGLSFDNFIRTTDEHHIAAAQEFWKRCDASGDIYKKIYKAKYCVGCELEVTDSQLVNGRCPIHPNKDVEIIEEENYFFRFSKYQQSLIDFYDANPDFVLPAGRFNEIKSFVSGGLQDFSISRVKEKMPWGIAVPGDENQVMYVWFDALVSYISCLGWPSFAKATEDKPYGFEFWGTKENRNAIQVAGKDNLRQQSAMWQAMLMSAGLPNSRQIFIHGFITANGQKMSKSLGNVIDPVELVGKYGTDATRYFMLRELPPTEDGDFSFEKFEERYNADLAKGIGNLAARVVAVAKKSGIDLTVNLDLEHIGGGLKTEIEAAKKAVSESLSGYRFNEALASIWKLITYCDQYTSQKEPWKTNDKTVLFNLLFALSEISNLVEPFLPETSLRMKNLLSGKSVSMLFPRLDAGIKN